MFVNQVGAKDLFSTNPGQTLGNRLDLSDPSYDSQLHSQLDMSDMNSQDWGSQQSQNSNSNSPGRKFYQRYMSKGPLFSKENSQGRVAPSSKVSFQQQLQNNKSRARERDERDLLNSMLSTTKECAAEVKGAVMAVQQILRDGMVSKEEQLSQHLKDIISSLAQNNDGIKKALAVRENMQQKMASLEQQLAVSNNTISELKEQIASLQKEKQESLLSSLEDVYHEQHKQTQNCIQKMFDRQHHELKKHIQTGERHYKDVLHLAQEHKAFTQKQQTHIRQLEQRVQMEMKDQASKCKTDIQKLKHDVKKAFTALESQQTEELEKLLNQQKSEIQTQNKDQCHQLLKQHFHQMQEVQQKHKREVQQFIRQQIQLHGNQQNQHLQKVIEDLSIQGEKQMNAIAKQREAYHGELLRQCEKQLQIFTNKLQEKDKWRRSQILEKEKTHIQMLKEYRKELLLAQEENQQTEEKMVETEKEKQQKEVQQQYEEELQKLKERHEQEMKMILNEQSTSKKKSDKFVDPRKDNSAFTWDLPAPFADKFRCISVSNQRQNINNYNLNIVSPVIDLPSILNEAEEKQEEKAVSQPAVQSSCDAPRSYNLRTRPNSTEESTKDKRKNTNYQKSMAVVPRKNRTIMMSPITIAAKVLTAKSLFCKSYPSPIAAVLPNVHKSDEISVAKEESGDRERKTNISRKGDKKKGGKRNGKSITKKNNNCNQTKVNSVPLDGRESDQKVQELASLQTASKADKQQIYNTSIFKIGKYDELNNNDSVINREVESKGSMSVYDFCSEDPHLSESDEGNSPLLTYNLSERQQPHRNYGSHFDDDYDDNDSRWNQAVEFTTKNLTSGTSRLDTAACHFDHTRETSTAEMHERPQNSDSAQSPPFIDLTNDNYYCTQYESDGNNSRLSSPSLSITDFVLSRRIKTEEKSPRSMCRREVPTGIAVAQSRTQQYVSDLLSSPSLNYQDNTEEGGVPASPALQGSGQGFQSRGKRRLSQDDMINESEVLTGSLKKTRKRKQRV